MPGAMTYTIGFEKTNINHHCTPCCFSIYSPRVLATNNQISGAATASLQIHKVLIAATLVTAMRPIPWIPTKLSQGEGSLSVDYKIGDRKVKKIYIAIPGLSYIAF